MRVTIHDDPVSLGRAAADEGAGAIRAAIEARGAATVVVATGASQFEMLSHLVTLPLDWSRITAFHLDEYVGIGRDHPASFRRYLRERLVERVDGLREFVAVDGDAADLAAELGRLNGRLEGERVDVCFAGIGENGHLAFNDPPADFDIEDPYLVVELDERCRRQQLGEGWFADLDAVPLRAISMSIRQIMRSELLVLSVPDERKAEAVAHAVEGEVGEHHPASIVQRHGDAALHLEPGSASRLSAARS